MFENFAVFCKSPQNLRVVFKQRSESPQISAILRKTCANNAEKQLKKPAHKNFPATLTKRRRLRGIAASAQSTAALAARGLSVLHGDSADGPLRPRRSMALRAEGRL